MKPKTALDRLNCRAKWVILELSVALLGMGTFSVEKINGGPTALELKRYDWWGMRKKRTMGRVGSELIDIVILT